MTSIIARGFVGLFTAGLLWGLSSASAVLLTIQNHSFETPVMLDGTYTSGIGVQFWIDPTPSQLPYAMAPGVFNPQNAHYTGSTGPAGLLPGTGDGYQLAYTFGGGYMLQDLDPTLNPGGLAYYQPGIYTLTLAVGNRAATVQGNYIFYLRNPANQNLATATGVVDALPEGTFTDVSLSYVVQPGNPNIGQQIRIVLYQTTAADYDNVRLEFVGVPEPSVVMLLGLGALLLWRRVHRR